MYAFDYHAPTTLAAARAALAGNDEAKLLAGGMTLLPTMKLRLARPAAVIDLNRVPDLAGIRLEGDALVIGALTRHAEVERSALVQARLPALAALAHGIGDPQVRNRGTLGGSVANNDPAADYPAALLALGATVVTDRRTIAADDFFTGMFETALAPDEIVTAVRFPLARRGGYAKFPNPASRYAIAGVFVADTAAGVRVGVTGAAPCAFRAGALESALAATFAPGALVGGGVAATDYNHYLPARAAYRAHVVGVMARRADTTALATTPAA
jgi:carbon-monoxide dehydrogenase medium subunit